MAFVTPEFKRKLNDAIKTRIREVKDSCTSFMESKLLCRNCQLFAMSLGLKPATHIKMPECDYITDLPKCSNGVN